MELNLSNLENCFIEAHSRGFSYVGVKIRVSNLADYEVVINPNSNFSSKMEYYKNAYNDDLTLKSAPDKIKIVGFTYGNFYSDIATELLGL